MYIPAWGIFLLGTLTGIVIGVVGTVLVALMMGNRES